MPCSIIFAGDIRALTADKKRAQVTQKRNENIFPTKSLIKNAQAQESQMETTRSRVKRNLHGNSQQPLGDDALYTCTGTRKKMQQHLLLKFSDMKGK